MPEATQHTVLATDRICKMIGATAALFILGTCLAGRTGLKDDPPPCDPTNLQAQGMASLSPTGAGCPSLVRPSFNSDH